MWAGQGGLRLELVGLEETTLHELTFELKNKVWGRGALKKSGFICLLCSLLCNIIVLVFGLFF